MWCSIAELYACFVGRRRPEEQQSDGSPDVVEGNALKHSTGCVRRTGSAFTNGFKINFAECYLFLMLLAAVVVLLREPQPRVQSARRSKILWGEIRPINVLKFVKSLRSKVCPTMAVWWGQMFRPTRAIIIITIIFQMVKYLSSLKQ